MTSLSQRSPKNKTTWQLDLFADEAPAERADDVAPAVAAPAHDPLAGLVVQFEHDFCRCGSNVATIGDGKAMHRASLSCRSCGRHRGWLSRFIANWIESVISLHGRPDKTIMVRGPRLLKSETVSDLAPQHQRARRTRHSIGDWNGDLTKKQFQ